MNEDFSNEFLKLKKDVRDIADALDQLQYSFTKKTGTGSNSIKGIVDGYVQSSEVFVSGETINGGTLPVPVYIKNADTRVYASDANLSGALEFFGFAVTNSIAANNIEVQVTGVVGGFSGLTVGATYYVSDTVGTISTTPGTVQIVVGIAVSATQILIQHQPIGGLIAGTTTIASADTERTTGSSTYVKVKEIEIVDAGTVTVSFGLRTSNAAETTNGRVYKNGVAFGTEQSTASTTFVTKSENLVFAPGDLIQLYIKVLTAGTSTINNFQIAVAGRNPTLVVTD